MLYNYDNIHTYYTRLNVGIKRNSVGSKYNNGQSDCNPNAVRAKHCLKEAYIRVLSRDKVLSYCSKVGGKTCGNWTLLTESSDIGVFVTNTSAVCACVYVWEERWWVTSRHGNADNPLLQEYKHWIFTRAQGWNMSTPACPYQHLENKTSQS